MASISLRARIIACSALAGLGVAGSAWAQAGAPDTAAPPNQTPPGSGASMAAPAGVASTRPPPSPSGSEVGEVVVTANRRSETLDKVGESVAAVSAQQLRIQNVKTPLDLARVVPGFQALTSSLTGAPVYNLRGVGFDTPNVTTVGPVGIYVDEVAYAYPYMSIGEAYDLERVEVLKGPQGTLYGRNTTGGLVDLIPAKPTNTPQASFSAGIGNYDEWQLSGFASGPITDTLKGRIAFDSENREDDWQHSVTRDDGLGKLHRNSVRGILDWTPISRFSAELSANYWEKTGDTQAPQATTFLSGTPNAVQQASLIPHPTSDTQADFTPITNQPQSNITGIIRPPDHTNDNFYGLAAKLNYKITDQISLASLTSYNRLGFYNVQEANGLQDEGNVDRTSGYIQSFSEELRLIGTYDRFNWSVGGYYAYDHTDENTEGYVDQLDTIVGLRAAGQEVNGLFGFPYTPTQIGTSFRNYADVGVNHDTIEAGFANLEYKITDQLKLSGGVRYTQDRLTGESCGLDTNGNNLAIVNLLYPVLTGNFALPPLQENGCYTLNANDTAFELVHNYQKKGTISWRTSVDYSPTNRTLIYASVSRGYKSGAFPVLAASNATQLAPVTDEQLTAYEVGAKVGLFDHRVQVNSDIYYYDYDNRQVFGRESDLIFGSLQRIVNIPKSEVYGVESDVTWRIVQSLTARVSGAYLQTRVNDYSGFNTLGTAVVNYDGATLPYSPHFQMNGSLVDDQPVTNALNGFGAVNMSYQSSSSAVLGKTPGFGIAPYALFGLTAGVHPINEQWRLEGYVDNLFNRYYWTTAQTNIETIVRFAGMPRTYGLRLTYNFR